jgi:hypothetical protein
MWLPGFSCRASPFRPLVEVLVEVLAERWVVEER